MVSFFSFFKSVRLLLLLIRWRLARTIAADGLAGEELEPVLVLGLDVEQDCEQLLHPVLTLHHNIFFTAGSRTAASAARCSPATASFRFHTERKSRS